MDEILGVDRNVEIEHMAQPANVDAACGDIRAAEQAQFTGLELLKRGKPHRLGHVTMQGPDRETMAGEGFVENVHIALAVAEDQRVLHIFRADEATQGLALIVLGHHRQTRGDGCRHRCRLGDGDLLRVLQERIGQSADFRGHRGGEEQRLPIRRQHGDDLLNVWDEAHVEHAVSFVDHQNRGLGEQHAATFEHIDQTARRGDQHVHALVEQLFLIAHALTADDQRMGELEVLAVFDEVFGHLQGEFARRL